MNNEEPLSFRGGAEIAQPFGLSLSEPDLSACVGRQSKGAALLENREGQSFDKLGPNGFGGAARAKSAPFLISLNARAAPHA
jgi:hypothetical protein